MNTSSRLVVAVSLAFAAANAAGVELSDAQRVELRERAQTLQAQRVQNPSMAGDLSLDRPQGDVKLDQNKGEVKPRVKTAKKPKSKSKSKGKPRHGRSLSDLPGAFVR